MHIIVFGDSIAYGAADSKHGGWVQLLKSYLEERTGFGTLVYNLGISGDSSMEIAARFEPELNARIDPVGKNIVIIAIGSNDSYYFGTDEEKTNVSEVEYTENLEKMISIANRLGCKILFLGIEPLENSKLQPVPWRKEISYSNENCRRFNEIVKSVCSKNNLPFMDSFGVLSKSGYMEHLEDGCHPDSEGHEMLFKLVLKFLRDNGVLE